jgi:NifU-like protein
MSFYPPKISEKFLAPQHAGRANGANAVGTNATFVCGAAVRFTLRIDKNAKQIVEAKFQTNACGYATAAAEILGDKITGKFLADLHGFDDGFLKREIENQLGAFEFTRQHCLELALQALHCAFADFRIAQLEEWAGERALVCTCFGVSEETIERVIENESAETVEEVTASCNAGGGCGSCQPLIQELIDVYRSEK